MLGVTDTVDEAESVRGAESVADTDLVNRVDTVCWILAEVVGHGVDERLLTAVDVSFCVIVEVFVANMVSEALEETEGVPDSVTDPETESVILALADCVDEMEPEAVKDDDPESERSADAVIDDIIVTVPLRDSKFVVDIDCVTDLVIVGDVVTVLMTVTDGVPVVEGDIDELEQPDAVTVSVLEPVEQEETEPVRDTVPLEVDVAATDVDEVKDGVDESVVETVAVIDTDAVGRPETEPSLDDVTVMDVVPVLEPFGEDETLRVADVVSVMEVVGVTDGEPVPETENEAMEDTVANEEVVTTLEGVPLGLPDTVVQAEEETECVFVVVTDEVVHELIVLIADPHEVKELDSVAPPDLEFDSVVDIVAVAVIKVVDETVVVPVLELSAEVEPEMEVETVCVTEAVVVDVNDELTVPDVDPDAMTEAVADTDGEIEVVGDIDCVTEFVFIAEPELETVGVDNVEIVGSTVSLAVVHPDGENDVETVAVIVTEVVTVKLTLRVDSVEAETETVPETVNVPVTEDVTEGINELVKAGVCVLVSVTVEETEFERTEEGVTVAVVVDEAAFEPLAVTDGETEREHVIVGVMLVVTLVVCVRIALPVTDAVADTLT